MIKNGKNEGMFIPMKKERRNGQEDNAGNDADAEDNRQNGGDDGQNENGEEHETRTKIEEENGEEGEDMLEPLPPPQAILGSPSGAECSDDNDNHHQESTSNGNYQKQNGSGRGQDKGNSSRRSSANVVSSSDAHNGDNEEYDEVDSSGEYENSNGLVDPANMLKCKLF